MKFIFSFLFLMSYFFESALEAGPVLAGRLASDSSKTTATLAVYQRDLNVRLAAVQAANDGSKAAQEAVENMKHLVSIASDNFWIRNNQWVTGNLLEGPQAWGLKSVYAELLDSKDRGNPVTKALYNDIVDAIEVELKLQKVQSRRLTTAAGVPYLEILPIGRASGSERSFLNRLADAGINTFGMSSVRIDPQVLGYGNAAVIRNDLNKPIWVISYDDVFSPTLTTAARHELVHARITRKIALGIDTDFAGGIFSSDGGATAFSGYSNRIALDEIPAHLDSIASNLRKGVSPLDSGIQTSLWIIGIVEKAVVDLAGSVGNYTRSPTVEADSKQVVYRFSSDKVPNGSLTFREHSSGRVQATLDVKGDKQIDLILIQSKGIGDSNNFNLFESYLKRQAGAATRMAQKAKTLVKAKSAILGLVAAGFLSPEMRIEADSLVNELTTSSISIVDSSVVSAPATARPAVVHAEPATGNPGVKEAADRVGQWDPNWLGGRLEFSDFPKVLTFDPRLSTASSSQIGDAFKPADLSSRELRPVLPPLNQNPNTTTTGWTESTDYILSPDGRRFMKNTAFVDGPLKVHVQMRSPLLLSPDSYAKVAKGVSVVNTFNRLLQNEPSSFSTVTFTDGVTRDFSFIDPKQNNVINIDMNEVLAGRTAQRMGEQLVERRLLERGQLAPTLETLRQRGLSPSNDFTTFILQRRDLVASAKSGDSVARAALVAEEALRMGEQLSLETKVRSMDSSIPALFPGLKEQVASRPSWITETEQIRILADASAALNISVGTVRATSVPSLDIVNSSSGTPTVTRPDAPVMPDPTAVNGRSQVQSALPVQNGPVDTILKGGSISIAGGLPAGDLPMIARIRNAFMKSPTLTSFQKYAAQTGFDDMARNGMNELERYNLRKVDEYLSKGNALEIPDQVFGIGDNLSSRQAIHRTGYLNWAARDGQGWKDSIKFYKAMIEANFIGFYENGKSSASILERAVGQTVREMGGLHQRIPGVAGQRAATLGPDSTYRFVSDFAASDRSPGVAATLADKYPPSGTPTYQKSNSRFWDPVIEAGKSTTAPWSGSRAMVTYLDETGNLVWKGPLAGNQIGQTPPANVHYVKIESYDDQPVLPRVHSQVSAAGETPVGLRTRDLSTGPLEFLESRDRYAGAAASELISAPDATAKGLLPPGLEAFSQPEVKPGINLKGNEAGGGAFLEVSMIRSPPNPQNIVEFNGAHNKPIGLAGNIPATIPEVPSFRMKFSSRAIRSSAMAGSFILGNFAVDASVSSWFQGSSGSKAAYDGLVASVEGFRSPIFWGVVGANSFLSGVAATSVPYIAATAAAAAPAVMVVAAGFGGTTTAMDLAFDYNRAPLDRRNLAWDIAMIPGGGALAASNDMANNWLLPKFLRDGNYQVPYSAEDQPDWYYDWMRSLDDRSPSENSAVVWQDIFGFPAAAKPGTRDEAVTAVLAELERAPRLYQGLDQEDALDWADDLLSYPMASWNDRINFRRDMNRIRLGDDRTRLLEYLPVLNPLQNAGMQNDIPAQVFFNPNKPGLSVVSDGGSYYMAPSNTVSGKNISMDGLLKNTMQAIKDQQIAYKKWKIEQQRRNFARMLQSRDSGPTASIGSIVVNMLIYGDAGAPVNDVTTPYRIINAVVQEQEETPNEPEWWAPVGYGTVLDPEEYPTQSWNEALNDLAPWNDALESASAGTFDATAGSGTDYSNDWQFGINQNPYYSSDTDYSYGVTVYGPCIDPYTMAQYIDC